jgi:hypothetical protein
LRLHASEKHYVSNARFVEWVYVELVPNKYGTPKNGRHAAVSNWRRVNSVRFR